MSYSKPGLQPCAERSRSYVLHIAPWHSPRSLTWWMNSPCVPQAIACQPWLSFQKVLCMFFHIEEMARKEKVFSRVCKDLWPLCCGSWVLMVVGISSWSCLVPPKDGIEADDNLVMGNVHILWRGFHLFCTLPLHTAMECLCVRGFFGFSLLWTTF